MKIKIVVQIFILEIYLITNYNSILNKFKKFLKFNSYIIIFNF